MAATMIRVVPLLEVLPVVVPGPRPMGEGDGEVQPAGERGSQVAAGKETVGTGSTLGDGVGVGLGLGLGLGDSDGDGVGEGVGVGAGVGVGVGVGLGVGGGVGVGVGGMTTL